MFDGSGRYLIYRLLHRCVKVEQKGKRTNGVVNKVYRNIMDGVVELTVGNRSVTFDEPTTIRLDGDDVVFSYGSPGLMDDSDDALWEEVREGANSGESLGDVLRRTAPAYRRETRFCITQESSLA